MIKKNIYVIAQKIDIKQVFFIALLAMGITVGIACFALPVFAGEAAGTEAASTMITSVVSVIATLCTVVGIILGIVGLVKFIIAHANEQGPEQQKAIMWIAVAIILVIVPNVIKIVADNWTPLISVEGS